MRLIGPTTHLPGILVALALCAMPLLATGQTYGPNATTQASTSPPQAQAQPRKSLMGMVMAALIESAEQTARERRDAAHEATAVEATAIDQTRPSASTEGVRQPDRTPATSSEDAIRERMAMQDMQDEPR